jgi:peroxiredoxin
MTSLGTALLIGTTALTLFACSGTQTPDQTETHASLETPEPRKLVAAGQMAPDFTLQTIDGETVSLSDLRGRVVVIDFWTTWCLGCVQELPITDRFAQWVEEEDLPITVLALNTFGGKGQAKRLQGIQSYLEKKDLDLTIPLDPSGDPVAKAYGVRAFPSNIIIAPDGVISATAVGMQGNHIDWLKVKALAALE